MPTLFAVLRLGSGGAITAYFFITLVFLAISFLVATRVMNERVETKLILLGLLSAVAAIGYGAMVGGETASASVAGTTAHIATGPGAAAMLARLGVILVLAGVAASLLSYLNPSAQQRDEEGA